MNVAGPVIVGGGPAGSAAAIRLLQVGARPLIIERREGSDALCGGFLSWRTLEGLAALGISREELSGHTVTRLRLIAGRMLRCAELPAPAMGLSRRRLDRLMLARARRLGANVVQGTASYGDGRLWLGDAEPVDRAGLFLATGKHDLRGLPRSRDAAGHDPMMGLRLRVTPSDANRRELTGTIEMHLFPRGYAGIVLQDDGTANICMAVHKSRLAAAEGKPALLLAKLAAENPQLAARLADMPGDPAFDAIARVPYGWRATRGVEGIFRLGDQAGVIPSLAGEGIGIALASAEEAVRFWKSGGGAAAPAFQQHLSARLRRPLAVAGLVARLGEGKRGAVLLTLLAAIPGAAALVAGMTRV
ncbi:MAG TPA: FAD-dependent monooxygenase [Devosia sp.]|nr:FAD-dependent monooxygenase [Devosia sp.]